MCLKVHCSLICQAMSVVLFCNTHTRQNLFIKSLAIKSNHLTQSWIVVSELCTQQSTHHKRTPLIPLHFNKPFNHQQVHIQVYTEILIFTYVTCILILSKFFYSPTDAQANCLKNNFKDNSIVHQLVLAKVTVVKTAN